MLKLLLGVNSAKIKEHKKINEILNVTVDFCK